jgi:hypothetical protein
MGAASGDTAAPMGFNRVRLKGGMIQCLSRRVS